MWNGVGKAGTIWGEGQAWCWLADGPAPAIFLLRALEAASRRNPGSSWMAAAHCVQCMNPSNQRDMGQCWLCAVSVLGWPVRSLTGSWWLLAPPSFLCSRFPEPFLGHPAEGPSEEAASPPVLPQPAHLLPPHCGFPSTRPGSDPTSLSTLTWMSQRNHKSNSKTKIMIFLQIWYF